MARLFVRASSHSLEATVTFPGFPFSMAAWTWIQSSGGGIIMAFGNSAFFGGNVKFHALRFNAIGSILEARSTDGIFANDTSAYAYPGSANTRWVHVCGVWRSATNREVFYNGISGGVNTTAVGPALDRFCIGESINQGDFWDGPIDYPTVWARDLTQSDVVKLAHGVHPLEVRAAEIWGFTDLPGSSLGRAVIRSSRTGPVVLNIGNAPIGTSHRAPVRRLQRSPIGLYSLGVISTPRFRIIQSR